MRYKGYLVGGLLLLTSSVLYAWQQQRLQTVIAWWAGVSLIIVFVKANRV